MSFINLSLAHPVAKADETATGQLVAMGARFVMDGGDADGRFGLIEHPIIPRGSRRRCTYTPARTNILEMDFDSVERLVAAHGLVAAVEKAAAAY